MKTANPVEMAAFEVSRKLAEFFASQQPTGPLPEVCPLTSEGARNAAEAANIDPSDLDAATPILMRTASEQWNQLRRTRELDEKIAHAAKSGR